MMMTSPRMTRRRLSSMEHNPSSAISSLKEQQQIQSSMMSSAAALHRIELSSSDDARSDDDEEDDEHHPHHDDLLHDDESKAIARGGVVTPFPWKLHDMLEDAEDEGREHIVSWQAHGRSFMVHQPKDFVSQIMKKYFNQSKFASFQRQLNLYGFRRLTHGRDKGAYWHECFVRGQRSLCKGMIRQKIKGTKVRKTLAPHEEPDFYKQEWALSKKHATHSSSSPHHTGDDKTTTSTTVPASATTTATASSSNYDELPKPLPLPPLVSPTVGPQVSPDMVERNDMEMTVTEVSIPTASSDDSAAMITTSSSSSSLDEMVEDPYETVNTTTAIILPDTSDTHQGSSNSNNNTVDDCNWSIHNSISMKNVKGGDLLFFEGRPFHYLEHLEGLPSSHPSSSVMSLAAVFCQAQPSAAHQPPSSSNHLSPSLSRLDLDRLVSINMCSV